MSNGTRTFGDWREVRGWAFGSLTEKQTTSVVALIATAFAVVILTTMQVIPLDVSLALLVPWIAVFVLTVWPSSRYRASIGGELIIRARGARARRAGTSVWESGVLTEHPRREELPGVLGPIMPLTATDGIGQKYGLLWDRRTGRLTASLRLAPVGTFLAGQETSDLWINSYSGWLARLGHEPTVEWVAITVECAPGTGTELADHVKANIAEGAPQLAKQLLQTVADSHRGASADVETRASITFQPSKASPPPADMVESAAEVSRALSGLESDLAMCGTSVVGRSTTAHHTQWIRGAFDVPARAEMSRLRAEDHALAWSDTGAVVASDQQDHYEHDGCYSVSWALRDLPNQAVPSTVLAPLLSPGKFLRRVTITYRPVPAADAAGTVDREKRGSTFRSEVRRRRRIEETEREKVDKQRADRAAQEEARGAGVGLWAVYITTTVLDPRTLNDAVADVENRARSAKLRLRRANSWQAAAFAAALGVGVYPPDVSKRGRWR